MKNTSKAAKRHCLRSIKFHTGKTQKQRFSSRFEPPEAARGISMPALAQEKLHTIDDIYALPNRERAELIDGQIYMTIRK